VWVGWLACELSHPGCAGSAAWRENIPNLNLLNERLIDSSTLHRILKDCDEQFFGAGIFEPSLLGCKVHTPGCVSTESA